MKIKMNAHHYEIMGQLDHNSLSKVYKKTKCQEKQCTVERSNGKLASIDLSDGF
jgi:hypothetical protein